MASTDDDDETVFWLVEGKSRDADERKRDEKDGPVCGARQRVGGRVGQERRASEV